MRRNYRIALVTCEQFRSVAEEDVLLVERLTRLGHTAVRPAWEDEKIVWSAFDAAVIRSPWDYQYHLPDFLKWLERIEQAGVRLFNPPEVLRWNCHKGYLQELKAKGTRIPETVWIEPGAKFDLREILTAKGWSEAAVKPVIGAGGWFTHRVTLDQAADHAANSQPELLNRGVMIQEFLPEIVREGEWSLLFFGGEFSHAVIKKPAPSEFRVQVQHGGVFESARPTQELIGQAAAILTHAPGDLLYARVDGIVRDGQFMLIELEAFEPWFYLAQSETLADRFIEKLIASIQNTRQ